MLRPRRDPASVPVHWLKGNAREWSPADVLFFDTETKAEATESGEVLRLSTWAAQLVQRRVKKGPVRSPEWAAGNTAADFADWLDTAGRRQRTLWCFAHNLAFDVVTLRLPLEMRRRGWRLTDFSTNDTAPFFRLALVDHSIVLTDSWSWLPVALSAVGKAVGRVKPPLPRPEAPCGDLEARCRADVGILADAVLSLMDWWDSEHLGNWTLTGAGCGWNAFRHRGGEKSVLIDPDPEARTFERSAIYGGRREAFRIGPQPAGRYLEMDLKNAYPTVAAHFPLPVKRIRAFDSLPLDHSFLRSPLHGVIAECLIESEQPGLPMRFGGQVFYPVGRYRTVLAQPEIMAALGSNTLVEIGPGYAYRLGYNMAHWAAWIIDLANGRAAGAPPVAQLAGKHWSRAVIGKWASRGTELEDWGPAMTSGWSAEEGWNDRLKAPCTIIDIAGRRWLATKNQETDNAFPAITAFVESHVRVALSRCISAVSPGQIISCDTDGLIYDDSERESLFRVIDHHRRANSPLWQAAQQPLNDLITAAEPFLLVEKNAHAHLEMLGPVHWSGSDGQRLSGIRADATRDAEGGYNFLTWPKLSWQLAHGRTDGYVRASRRVRLSGPYTKRWVLDDGSTAAPVAHLAADGRSILLPFSATSAAISGLQLAPAQHRLLTPLSDR